MKQPQMKPAVSNSRPLRNFIRAFHRSCSSPVNSLSARGPQFHPVPQASARHGRTGRAEVGLGQCGPRKGTKARGQKKAVKFYGFKIARVNTMVTMVPFLTLPKSRDEIRL